MRLNLYDTELIEGPDLKKLPMINLCFIFYQNSLFKFLILLIFDEIKFFIKLISKSEVALISYWFSYKIPTKVHTPGCIV